MDFKHFDPGPRTYGPGAAAARPDAGYGPALCYLLGILLDLFV